MAKGDVDDRVVLVIVFILAANAICREWRLPRVLLTLSVALAIGLTSTLIWCIAVASGMCRSPIRFAARCATAIFAS